MLRGVQRSLTYSTDRHLDIGVGLQRKEVSPEQAKSQLTAHLECESYCDRWEDCENLLRFIDQEVAKQTRE